MYQFRLGKIGKELKSKANWIAPIALGIALLGIASQRVAGIPPVIATGEGAIASILIAITRPVAKAIAEAEIEPNAITCVANALSEGLSPLDCCCCF